MLPEPQPTPFPPPVPTPTFRYRILAKVGEGAMGEVYRALDPDLDRHVAIKVIKPAHLDARHGLAGPSIVERFLQEARAAAALTHPGVTTVHHVGLDRGRPYIAMEWIEGKTLEDVLLLRERLPVDEVARLGIGVLAPLAAAHALGIVHRDIKPGNLMITLDGRLKITDFGIARVQGSSLASTQAGAILGTPHYAAPEQLTGGPIDRRADLYAVASVLYEALTGRPPFEADTMFELISQVATIAPPPPSAWVPGLPPGLDAVLLAGLAKDPDQRFQSATDMMAALHPFLEADAEPGASTRRRTSSPLAVPAPPTVPTRLGAGATPMALVRALIEQWPATAVAPHDRPRLLERLLERPLHAPAFCGALEIDGAYVLIGDGLVVGAFAPATGQLGDDVLDGLALGSAATLRALPPDLAPAVLPLLASLTLPPKVRQAGLDSSYADLPQLAEQLAAEGFDGVLRLCAGPQVGFVLLSKGARVLDVFSEGWPADPCARRWEAWIATTGARASVEELRTSYPAITFRRELRGLVLDVTRPAATRSSVRSDTVADARALALTPRDSSRTQLRRGDTVLTGLVEADPAHGLARWVLTELGPQFERHGRTSAWKALVQPLASITEVRLHADLHRGGTGSATETFDVVALGDHGRVHHVIERVGRGTADAVAQFIARAVAVKAAGGVGADLAAAILCAPAFDDAALEAYLAALRPRAGRGLLAGLDALAHRDGYLRLGVRSGLHVLLVEDDSTTRRPLVIE